jgi:hypothetical protein
MHGGDEHQQPKGGAFPTAEAPVGVGHNHPSNAKRPVQWQTAHRDNAPTGEEGRDRTETDLDLVEAAFIEGFLLAGDPTSFLRLARVPFEGRAADGAKLALLRIEIDSVTDVGSITPHLGGASFRYDPLPARMASRRKRLRLIYFDGQKPRTLGLAEAASLAAP